mgnify:FL=1
MKPFNHLIAKHGILVSFNIAKKLKKAYIKSIEKEINKLGGDKKTRRELLDEEIKRNAVDTMKVTDIPGLILPKSEILKEKNIENSFMKDQSKVSQLMLFANHLSKKILEKKFPKEQICFLIITLINSLGLTDDDFKNFHKKHNPSFFDDDDDFIDEEDIDNEDDDDGEELI